MAESKSSGGEEVDANDRKPNVATSQRSAPPPPRSTKPMPAVPPPISSAKGSAGRPVAVDDADLDLALDRLMPHDATPVAMPSAPIATQNPQRSTAPPTCTQQAAAVPAPIARSTPPSMRVARPIPDPPLTTPSRLHTPSQSTSILSPDQHFPVPPPNKTTSSGKKSEPRQMIEIGENTTIDRFGLIREIARGGMGQVFLARDTKLGRKVAIKFLLHNDPTFAQRFLIEARATARCTHENIVAIYEVGEYQNLPYMVLEYLEGKTLSSVLETKPGPKPFSEIMLSVARALERAHEDGIVHRDLKPSNIFVTDRGQVKVLDFGVARIFDPGGDAMEQVAAGATKHPRSESHGDGNTYVTFSGGGTLVGTLPYMSPEQWGADTVDGLSDLWACGIMFWRALTGVHPAGSMNADKLRVRLCDLDTPLPSLGAREPSIPKELVAIVDRCLRKRKSERYRSATELIADLQAFLAPSTERISEDVCPYRGLAAFGETDAKYFFGRSNEIRTALSQLDTWPLLAVIGPSGVGKSSFVHAGLAPAVRATGGNWQVRVLRPGRTPLHSLAATLDDAIETGQIAMSIVDQLHDAPGLYAELLRSSARRKRHKVLIVVDQLEELFTLSDDDEVRKLFLAALLAAADDPTSPVRVVLSMRADFLDRLAGHKHFLAELSRGLFFLSAPDRDNLRETVVRPAELAGYGFENPSIVEDMMQAASSKGALPLLQFAATRLWDGRDRKRRSLTVAAYDQMGRVGGAFARHADEIAAAVPPQSQALLRAIMTRLVTPEGTRAVIDHNELLGLAADPAEVERILDQLVRARLVLLHTDPNQNATVEIVHEVLITEWPTLARWLEDSQALRGFLNELRQATKQWVGRGKAADLVWRGATAQEALATAKKHVLDLSVVEKEFLEAARQQIARGRRRKVLALATVFVVIGLVLAGGAFFTIQLAQANQEAQQKAIEAEKAEAKVAAQLETVKAAEKLASEAKTQIQAQLDEVKAAEAQRAKAEAAKTSAEQEASKANEQVAQSKEDLQKALVVAQQEKVVAVELAKKAAVAAEVAKKATEDARAANARLQTLFAAEKERVRQLELEKSKISTGGLR